MESICWCYWFDEGGRKLFIYFFRNKLLFCFWICLLHFLYCCNVLIITEPNNSFFNILRKNILSNWVTSPRTNKIRRSFSVHESVTVTPPVTRILHARPTLQPLHLLYIISNIYYYQPPQHCSTPWTTKPQLNIRSNSDSFGNG